MTVESASYISQLNASYPTSADAKSEGDDHIRLLKTVFKTQFPNFGAAALAASNTQLDKVVTTISINASAPSSALVVDASGNVGIGVAPVYRAHFYNSSAPMVEVLESASTSDAILRFRNGANGALGGLIGRGAVGLAFEAGANEKMWLDANGNCIKALNSSAPSLSNGQMVVTLASDTQLRFTVKGNDGTTRTANLTLA